MISASSITTKLNAYAKTTSGKAKIKSVSSKDIHPPLLYGEKMKKILFAEVSAVIPSISFDDISVSEPIQIKDGMWKVYVGFNEEAMHRDSLWKTGYPEGIDNIAVLFSNGYQASNHVYGMWHGNMTASKKQRSPNNFMGKAVAEFNMSTPTDVIANYSSRYLGGTL